MIAPEDILFRAIGQGLLQQADQPQHHRIELRVHQLRAPFGRVRHLRGKLGVILPALAALDIEVEVGIQERAQRAFDRGFALGRGVIILQRAHTPLAGDDRAPREHRVEQGLLVREIIIEQRVVDADRLGHILQRHPIEAVLGEQILGRIQDLLDRLGALLGFLGAAPRFDMLVHMNGLSRLCGRAQAGDEKIFTSKLVYVDRVPSLADGAGQR